MQQLFKRNGLFDKLVGKILLITQIVATLKAKSECCVEIDWNKYKKKKNNNNNYNNK